MDKEYKFLGRAEEVSFPELCIDNVPARVDTGARTSAISVSHVSKKSGIIEVVFCNDSTSKVHKFTDFKRSLVISSTGHTQRRYKVRLVVFVGGKRIRAWFTLAKRDQRTYPVLIGRNVLAGKFIVDVKRGIDSKAKKRAAKRNYGLGAREMSEHL